MYTIICRLKLATSDHEVVTATKKVPFQCFFLFSSQRVTNLAHKHTHGGIVARLFISLCLFTVFNDDYDMQIIYTVYYCKM